MSSELVPSRTSCLTISILPSHTGLQDSYPVTFVPFPPFFSPMSGSSSFKSQLRIPSLEKTSLSPRATVAFLGHSRSHYPRNTFLTILIEAVLIPWLVVWAPPPPHAHTWKLHDSRDTACLIYCFISPVWNECVCGGGVVIACDGLLLKLFAPRGSSLVLWSVPLDLHWDPPCVCEPIPGAWNLHCEPDGTLSRGQFLWTATACVSSMYEHHQ